MSKTTEFLSKQSDITNGKSCDHYVCKDGLKLSIQVGTGAYCTPRDYKGPYTHVELGVYGLEDPLLEEYSPDDLYLGKTTLFIYSYVPIELVDQLIEKHS